MSGWRSAVDQLQGNPGTRSVSPQSSVFSDQLRQKVMEKVQVKLAAEKDDWKALLNSQGLADRVQPQRSAVGPSGGYSPYTQANQARRPGSSDGGGSSRRGSAPPSPNPRAPQDPTPPASPAGPPPSSPMEGRRRSPGAARRGRPNRRMAEQTQQAPERDGKPRDWRARAARSPSIETGGDTSQSDDGQPQDVDERRLERARNRGRAAWEQVRVAEKQRDTIDSLRQALEAESQARGQAEATREELAADASVELEKLRAALADERATRERAEELLAVAADAGHQAIAEITAVEERGREEIAAVEEREAAMTEQLQAEIQSLREWQVAAADGTQAAAEKLVELQHEIYDREAQTKLAEDEKQQAEALLLPQLRLSESRQADAEAATAQATAATATAVAAASAATAQIQTKVDELTASLEQTQLHRKKAETALAQSKREGEIKDQAMQDGNTMLSELANRLSVELTQATMDADTARMAEAQVGAQLKLEEQSAQLAHATLEKVTAEREHALRLQETALLTTGENTNHPHPTTTWLPRTCLKAGFLVTANAYGDTLVPREWLSSVCEEFSERMALSEKERRLLTNLVDMGSRMQEEMQQRQNVMEEAVRAKLRMVAMGKIQRIADCIYMPAID